MNDSELNCTACCANSTNASYSDCVDAIEVNCSESHGAFPLQTVRVAIYVIYALIFVVSVIGNGIVCYIVIATPRMRTVTNYFIANLAIGDMLITTLCVPFTMIQHLLGYWPFYNFLCPVYSTAQAVSVFVSSYTLVAISVDRYVAIMWPLQPRLSKKSTACIILAVWMFSFITVLPISVVSKSVQSGIYYTVCDKYLCREDWDIIGVEYLGSYTNALLVLQYVAPVSVLIFTYTSIGIVIWCHRIPGEAEEGRDLRITRSKRKMIKMMVAVVVVYTMCWLPFNIYMIMRDMGIMMDYEAYIWLACHCLAMSHPCYNPVIYCYMNNRFRQGFAQIFGAFCCRSACDGAAGMHNNGRSRMSIPLTSIGGTDSTILHRNNTCTTYISTRRRTGNSRGGGAPPATPQRSTRSPFSAAEEIQAPPAPPSANHFPVRSLSIMRPSGGDANHSERETASLLSDTMQITRRSTRQQKNGLIGDLDMQTNTKL